MKVLNRITLRVKISLAIPSKPDSEALDYILRETVQSVIANSVVTVLRSSFPIRGEATKQKLSEDF